MSDNFWTQEQSLHEQPDQVKRQKNALRLNVEKIDTETQSGIINEYAVSLSECSCQDYKMRHMPCKHMYRLAHELGCFHLDGAIVNDPTTKNSAALQKDKKNLEQDIDNLSKDDKEFLHSVLYKYLYRNHAPLVAFKEDVPLSLCDVGLLDLLPTCALEHIADFSSKTALSALVKENTCAIKLNQKKIVILEVLQKDYPQVYQKFVSTLSFVVPSKYLLLSSRKIYNRLNAELHPYSDDTDWTIPFTPEK